MVCCSRWSQRERSYSDCRLDRPPVITTDSRAHPLRSDRSSVLIFYGILRSFSVTRAISDRRFAFSKLRFYPARCASLCSFRGSVAAMAAPAQLPQPGHRSPGTARVWQYLSTERYQWGRAVGSRGSDACPIKDIHSARQSFALLTESMSMGSHVDHCRVIHRPGSWFLQVLRYSGSLSTGGCG